MPPPSTTSNPPPIRDGASRAAERLPGRRDLLILRALVTYPWATDKEVGRVLGLPRATVTRARLRLLARGIIAPRYRVNLDRLSSGSVVVVCGRAGAEVSDREVGRALERLLREHRTSGSLLVEGGSFAGALFHPPHERLPLLAASALSLRAPHSSAYLVSHLDFYPFPGGDDVKREGVDYRLFVEHLTGKARLAATLPGRTPRGQGAAPPLRRTEASVAKSLLSSPGLPIAEAAGRAGISRSTFAHVKGALLAKGLLEPDIALNLPMLGFPLLLVVGHYRRPHRDGDGGPSLGDVLGHSSAPIAHLASATHEVAVAPYADLVSARNVMRDLGAREREFELLSPPFAAVFLLPQSVGASHGEPDNLASPWLQPYPQGEGAPQRASRRA